MSEEYNRQTIQNARYNFLHGLPFARSDVREIILESWERSQQYNLEYDTDSQIVLPIAKIKKRLEINEALLNAANDYLINLYEKILHREGMVLLSDAEGIILFALGSAGVYKAPEIGTDWSERSIGTNGVGTCVYLQKPIQIFAEEHYRTIKHAIYCSGSPIYAAEGQLIGCLNVTGASENVHAHTMGMVIGLANAIEKQLKVNQINEENQRFIRQQAEILNMITDAVLIVDYTGQVTHINDQGLFFFDIRAEDVVQKPLNKFIPSLDIQDIIASQKMLKDAEIDISLPQKDLSCRISSALTKDGKGAPESLILTFKHSKKINDLVNKITGSVAKYSFEQMIGKSALFDNIKRQGLIAAAVDANVLITGESGTGKDLMAQAIHRASARFSKPFLPINCGALPRNLVESELFGYEGGSFTGSKKEGNPGKFELADGGTIFLDEIGEMPLDVQVTLLRVIEDKLITRIGGHKSKEIDVRIIAATNQNLEQMVANHTFREDLFYRLNVLTINMPPLRERGGDLELLINSILERLRIQTGKYSLTIDSYAVNLLKSYRWPGNVRELENVLERAANICEGSSITYQDLPAAIYHEGQIVSPEIKTIKQNEIMLIMEMLSETNGNIKQAAERLGIARSTVYRKLKEYGI